MRWIKWLYVLGLTLTALLLLCLAALLPHPALGLVLILLAAAFGYGAAVLGFSPGVQLFLARQRGEPVTRADEDAREAIDKSPAGLCAACGQHLVPGIAFCSRCGRPTT